MTDIKKLPAARYYKQILCIGAGLVLGAVSWAVQEADTVVGPGNVLERPAAEDDSKEQELYVKGLTGTKEKMPVQLSVYPRQYTKEEAEGLYQEILKQLPGKILGENSSLEEVRQDLVLLNQWPEYGISLSWQSSDPELIESDGTVHGELLEETGRNGESAEDLENAARNQKNTDSIEQKVRLNVRMTDGNWPEEYSLSVIVKPALYTEEEQIVRRFETFLMREEEKQKNQKTFTLPAEYEGKNISYDTPKRPVFVQISFLGIAAAALVSLKEKNDKKKAKEDRNDQLLMDHSEMLSRLIIFLGAGMSIRTAWDRIGEDYMTAVKEERSPRRWVYEEMYITSCQLKRGEPEAKAFSEFGSRCGLQQYMKLSGLLEQNRKNGSKNLRETLRLEMAEAFEQRKHQARRMGEKAGTKLLIPLFLLLAVVMVMIMVPAWIAFGG